MYVCKSAYCIAAAAASALGSRYTQVNDFRSQEQKKKTAVCTDISQNCEHIKICNKWSYMNMLLLFIL